MCATWLAHSTRRRVLRFRIPENPVTFHMVQDAVNVEAHQSCLEALRHRHFCHVVAVTARFRLNRGGNRQTNAALHRIAITHLRIHPDAQAFIKWRASKTGSTKREAIRLLKRKLANVVHRTLLTDTQQTALAAAA